MRTVTDNVETSMGYEKFEYLQTLAGKRVSCKYKCIKKISTFEAKLLLKWITKFQVEQTSRLLSLDITVFKLACCKALQGFTLAFNFLQLTFKFPWLEVSCELLQSLVVSLPVHHP